MTNIRSTIEGGFLTLRIDLRQKHGKSKSGNSTKIASTGGNVNLEGDYKHIKLGLNCYTHKGHKFSAKKNMHNRINEKRVLDLYKKGELVEQEVIDNQEFSEELPF